MSASSPAYIDNVATFLSLSAIEPLKSDAPGAADAGGGDATVVGLTPRIPHAPPLGHVAGVDGSVVVSGGALDDVDGSGPEVVVGLALGPATFT